MRANPTYLNAQKKASNGAYCLPLKNESEDNDSGSVTGPAGNSSKFLKIIFARS
jgi:hypothetical protein